LPRGVEAAGLARRLCDEACRDWGFDSRAADCRLLVSELVTNAVVHARGAIRLEVEDGSGALRVSVSDGRRGLVDVQHPAPVDLSGRGLLLVDAIADRWGTDQLPLGKRVWFELAS